jgi:dolichol-phosphate mannosyltransferase
MSVRIRPLLVFRLAAAVLALSRLATAARRRPPLTADDATAHDEARDDPSRPTTDGEPLNGTVSISVVVPARDEAARIGPLLTALVDAPGIGEVIVVDDESTDGTAELARAGGATVVAGQPLPTGWAGKAWALQQGIDAASGAWVVTLDADTRPSPVLPLALVTRARAEHLHFVTVGGRFECPTPGAQWLHAAMLTTLVYRFGAAGRADEVPAHRHLANGQCMAFERERLAAAGGLGAVSGHVVEDVALARHLAAAGWSVAMVDGPDLLTTRMYDTLRQTATGWGRSLALPGVEPRWRQVIDLLVVVFAQSLPIPRVLLRRGDLLDIVLVATRLGTLAGTAQAYERPRTAYWLSPLADLPAAVLLARGVVTRRQSWRGRRYG